MNIDIQQLLKTAYDKRASDIHLTVGKPPVIRVNGELEELPLDKLTSEATEKYAKDCLINEHYEKFVLNGDVDSSMSLPGVGRFRINAYKQRGSVSIAIRLLASHIPSLEELELPAPVRELCALREGLVLVTGPTGSGKSTTVAAMINEINSNRKAHIITLEDPIEYLHRHNLSIIDQREIGHDSKTYTTALRAALREDPDVIFVGEMRDLESISIAITAAETGHLVLSTLHTLGSAKTIDRLIDVFPPYQQQQIRVQVSMTLKAVVSQRLLPNLEGSGRVGAFEVMMVTPAISNLIRDGKTSSINLAIQTGGAMGMQLLDKAIAELVRGLKISRQDAFDYCTDRETLAKLLGVANANIHI